MYILDEFHKHCPEMMSFLIVAGEKPCHHRCIDVNEHCGQSPHPRPTRSGQSPHPKPTRADQKPHPGPTQSGQKPHPRPTRSGQSPHPKPTRSDQKPHPRPTQSGQKPHPRPTRSGQSQHPHASRVPVQPKKDVFFLKNGDRLKDIFKAQKFALIGVTNTRSPFGVWKYEMAKGKWHEFTSCPNDQVLAIPTDKMARYSYLS